MDLVEFVTARLDEREAPLRDLDSCRRCIPGRAGERVDVHTFGEAACEHTFPAPYDPAHVLREVAAMRAIVAALQRNEDALHRAPRGEKGALAPVVLTLRWAVGELAAIWSEHEDYRAPLSV